MSEILSEAVEILRRTFGHASFRGRQGDVIRRVLDGEHVLLIMPTGMGKSLCYQIPALVLAEHADAGMGSPLTLVISPLIALMKDQVDSLNARGVKATFINSSLTRDERTTRYDQIAQGEYQLLYVTPERFRKSEFLDVIHQRSVVLLAIDEAHCISEWGHDFRPDYSRVAQWRELVGNPTTIALTATATPEVQHDIVRQLGLQPHDMAIIHEGIKRPNLELAVEVVWSDDQKLDFLQETLRGWDQKQGACIFYFTLIKTLERFSGELAAWSVPHVCYHGELERTRRRRIQNDFMQGRSKLVLATNAFGMGVDKEDIRHVVHVELPGSMESYYQEIGRAGRDGLPSRCTLLYDEKDLATQMEFIEWKNPDANFYHDVYDLLTRDGERVRAFGAEWLNKQLQCRSKFDHRLDTVLALFDRHGVVAGAHPPACFEVIAPMPESMVSPDRLQEKRIRDQRKLYALVQYVNCDGDRKRFINEYFGVHEDEEDAGMSR